MVVRDSVYGSFEIGDILEELVATDPVQRLGRISQGGAASLAFRHLKTTRLEHSLGVAHIVRRLGGDELEQIAGLLHDISHTAFSHVADYLFKVDGENFHEQFKKSFIGGGKIADVLRVRGIDPQVIADDTRWPRLERPLPDLCADRIDYTLRDYVNWAQRPAAHAQKFVDEIEFVEGKVVVKSPATARWFTNFYAELNTRYFRDPANLKASALLAEILKSALESGALTQDDLFRDDEWVTAKLRKTPLKEKFDSIPKLIADKAKSGPPPGFKLKMRRVDPWVRGPKGQIQRLSELH